MLDFNNMLDMFAQAGGSRSSNDRMRHAFGEKGLGGQGGLLGTVLEGVLGGGQRSSGGGGMGGLAKMAGELLGGGRSSGRGGLAAGGLGALAGALLGGGTKGALGGGVMALLGSLAISALQNRNRPLTESDASSMPLGLREPQDDGEADDLQRNAQLIIRAMINAAKADGQIDRTEMERISGKFQEIGADEAARDFVMSEMRAPFDVDGIIGQVPSPDVAAQLYAASLLAIEVDTTAEKQYLQRLAAGLGLDANVIGRLHQMLGVRQF